MTMRMAAVEEEGNTQSRVEELAGGIRELADEEKDGLLDLLMEKGFLAALTRQPGSEH